MSKDFLLLLALSLFPTLSTSGQVCDYPRRIYDNEPFVSDSLVADIDADGDQDAIFCYEIFDGMVGVALNACQGRLTPLEFFDTGRIPISIGCGDGAIGCAFVQTRK